MDIKILLVEDEPDHATLVQAMLDYRKLAGYVYVSQNVAEAKSYLLGEWPFDDPERTPTPGLLVLDHWLEDGTGLDLLEWMRNTSGLPDIPVVVFTGCRDPEVREHAEALGVEGFVLKPEGFDALGDAIEEIVKPKIRARSVGGRERSGPVQAG